MATTQAALLEKYQDAVRVLEEARVRLVAAEREASARRSEECAAVNAVNDAWKALRAAAPHGTDARSVGR